LAEKGKQGVAYATPLARFAIKQVRAGRQVGGRLNVRDPLSKHAQLQKGIKVQRLHRYRRETDEWIEVMVEDRRTPIPDQVAFRIDVSAWFALLPLRQCKIARDLALGWRTGDLARKHKLSAGRISQIRRELYRSWQRMHETGSAAVRNA
jgi:DNA-binding NarL/FixJ family response regulator